MSETIERKGYDDLWLWFGLSYASWLTLPRVLMHAMPDQWQADMARLLTAFDDAFQNQPDLSFYVQAQSKGRNVKMPGWLLNYRHPDRSAIDDIRGNTQAKVVHTPTPEPVENADSSRMEWLVRQLPGNVARNLIGELSNTSDLDQWRVLIDRARGVVE